MGIHTALTHCIATHFFFFFPAISTTEHGERSRVRAEKTAQRRAEDIRIIAEAACPVGLGQVRLNQFRNKEQELNGRTFERYCSDEYGFVHRAHSHIIRQALELYLHDAENKKHLTTEAPLAIGG